MQEVVFCVHISYNAEPLNLDRQLFFRSKPNLTENTIYLHY